MKKTFLFTVHRYLDGFWACVRCKSGVDIKRKRKLVSFIKRLGYEYSPSYHAYVFTNHDGVVNGIVQFIKEY